MKKIIAVDGVDGSGKSTAAHVLRDYLAIDRRLQVEMLSMPGSTALGQECRKLVKSKNFPTCELAARLLFATDTVQFLHEKLGAVEEEKTIAKPFGDHFFVMDRWNPITDLVYAGAAGGMKLVDTVADLQRILGFEDHPCDLYIIFRLPIETALQRKRGRIGESCRIEDKGTAFLSRVNEIFCGMGSGANGFATFDGEETSAIVHRITTLALRRARVIRRVDASHTPGDVAKQVRDIVNDSKVISS